MAAGYVTTGFSLPYVAKYAASGTTVTYSNGQKLARGVSATVTPTSTNTENNFTYKQLHVSSLKQNMIIQLTLARHEG